MRVDWLSLVDFRSYQTLDWSPDPDVNLLVGPNGAGKTNVLEGVGYLATLKSFRSVPDTVLVSQAAETAVLRAGVATAERSRLIEIEVPSAGRRRAQVDKTGLKRASDLLGVLRVIAFLPEDLDLIKRGPAYRRDLLDEIAVQLWPSSYLDQIEYERSVRQRNAFLKTGERDEVTLSVWDSRLAQTGGRVMSRRVRVMESISPLLGDAYGVIAGQQVEAAFGYSASWAEGELSPASAGEYADMIAEALERTRLIDYERRMTTVGPHRDDPRFSINRLDARTHASQGEQRTLALAVKLAAHAAVGDAIGETPVLLLDDVFSELDAERSAALAGALPAGTQTMITTARPEDVPVSGKTWSVRAGGIS